MTEPAFIITVYDSTVLPEALDEAVALYREVYAEPPYLEGEDDVASLAQDLPRRAKQESFRLVLARLGAEPLGFALGHRLTTPTRWWEGALTPLPPDLTVEHPGRTFAVIELAVRNAFRCRGLGRRLHSHLTVDLTEHRATLLVRPEAKAAIAAYLKWGYVAVGQIRPFPEAPDYNAMLRKLSDLTRDS